jgi:hypothetical protein
MPVVHFCGGMQAPNDLFVLLKPGERDDHVGDLALTVSMWWQSTEDTCDDAHAITPDYSFIIGGLPARICSLNPKV